MFEKQAMSFINSVGKEQLEALNKRYQDILDNQDQMTKALISLYQLVKLVAEKEGITVPEPLVKMEVEE